MIRSANTVSSPPVKRRREIHLWAWVIMTLSIGCASLEVRQVPFELLPKHPVDGELQYLALTKPAWLVTRSDGGSVALSPITVWDTDHAYEIHLASGWFNKDRLTVQTPLPTLDAAYGESRSKTDSLIYGNYLPPHEPLPDKKAIMDQFQQSGQRVFVFLRPEPVPKPPH